jgi:hypothetical protein
VVFSKIDFSWVNLQVSHYDDGKSRHAIGFAEELREFSSPFLQFSGLFAENLHNSMQKQ